MNEIQLKPRIGYIDLMRGIAIVIVVMGHFLENKISCNMPRLYEIIYSFHMPLFFAISGFTEGKFGKSILTGKNLFDYEKKAVYTLLIPYFVWLVITFYMQLHTPALWFLLTLFNIKIVLGGGKWLIANNIGKGFCFPIAVVVVVTGYAVMILSGYAYQNLLIWGSAFYFGLIIAKIKKVEMIANNQVMYALCFVMFTALCLVYSKQSDNYIYDFIKMANGMIAFVCLLNLCQILKIPNSVHNMLSWFGSKSISIYILHWLFVYWGKNIDLSLLFESNQWVLTIVVLTIAMVISTACVFLYEILTSNKYMAFLLFGKIKKR